MVKKVILGAVLFLVVISLVKDKIIEVSAENICTRVTGVKLDIDSLKVGLVRPVISIKDMKLYNPKGYPTEIMADIPEVYVHYNLPEMMTGKIYLEELRFNMKELDIVRNDEGKVNLDSLKPVKDKEDGLQIEERNKGKIPEMYIGTLYLQAGDVYYRDYSQKSEQPTVNKFEINLDEKYQDIRDPYTLIRLIIYRVLMNTTVSNVVDLPMSGVKEAYKTGERVVGGAVEKAGQAAGIVVEDTKNAFGKAAAGIEGLFSSQQEAKEE